MKKGITAFQLAFAVVLIAVMLTGCSNSESSQTSQSSSKPESVSSQASQVPSESASKQTSSVAKISSDQKVTSSVSQESSQSADPDSALDSILNDIDSIGKTTDSLSTASIPNTSLIGN